MTRSILEEKVARRRTLLIASAVAASVLLLGVGIGLAVLAHRPARPIAFRATRGVEASQTTSVDSSSTSHETSSVGPSPTRSATTTVVAEEAVPAHPGVIVRSPKIAFRLGGQIYVANEDGSEARSVYRSEGAPFSLSPDASTLAIAPSASGAGAVLVDIATGDAATVADAVDLPAWSADSSWVAYTSKDASGTFSVRRAARDGDENALIVKPGAAPRVSPNGRQVAFVRTNQPSSDDALAVVNVAGGKVITLPAVGGRKVAKADGSLGYAWSPTGVLYFAQAGGSAGTGYVGVFNVSLGSGRKVVALPSSPLGLAPDDLTFSPDGKRIVLTENGDDGYSRMIVVDVAKAKVSQLSTRRDAYPIRWTLDGTAILYVEGNAIQQETTALYRIGPSGTGRLVVVSGAGL